MNDIKFELALRVSRWPGRWRLLMSSRKQVEESSRETEDLTLILDSIPEIVASFDRDGRLLYLNASGRRWLRIGDEEIGKVILSDLLPDASAERLLREALPEAVRLGRWTGQGELLSRGGNPIPVLQQLLGHPPDDESLIAFTLVAIPAEDPIVDRETIVATSLGFLHDVNNLLGPIIAYAALAQDKLEASNPVQRYLAQILTAAERARGLSERVLKRMRPRHGDSRPVVIADLIHEVVGWLRTEHPHQEVEIEAPLSTRSIVGDPVGLQQMVLNLCKNAVEALPPLGGRSGSPCARSRAGASSE